MAKQRRKSPVQKAPLPGAERDIPPGATRKAVDRPTVAEGSAGPRHAADDIGTDNENYGRMDTNRTPASAPVDELDRLEQGPPYAGPSGGAVGGTPAQLRSEEGPPPEQYDPAMDNEEPPPAVRQPMVPPEAKGSELLIRLTGFEAIEYAEKQSLLLNKHPDSVDGPRTGLTVAEAEAIADEDADLIWMEVARDEYYDGPPASFEPEK